MPNPLGNPEFKSKYGEKTKVIRLPESIASAIASLLSQGCASSDILESLQPMTQQKLSDLAETDSTLVHLPVELRLLRAIKDVAKQQGSHYLQWITNQCKQGLNLSPNTSSASPALSEEQLTQLIDQRFDSLVPNLLNSLQAQLAAYESRLTTLEISPPLPDNRSEPTLAIAETDPNNHASQPGKLSKPNKQTPQPQPKTSQQAADKTEHKPKPDSSPIKLPKNFPPKGLPSVDLAKILNRHQKTINAHRRKGNGLLAGWEYKKVQGLAGWRYFPTTPEALKLWKNAIKNGKLNPASAAND